MYDELSKIAPTFADEPLNKEFEWKQFIRKYAKLAGESEAVEKAIAESDRKFADMRAQLTKLKGKTYQFSYWNAESGYGLVRNAALEELGFIPTEILKREGLKPAKVSTENTSQIDADIIVFRALIPEEEFDRSNPEYQALTAVRNNAVLGPPNDKIDTYIAAIRWLPGGEEYIEEFVVDSLKKSSYYSK